MAKTGSDNYWSIAIPWAAAGAAVGAMVALFALRSAGPAPSNEPPRPMGASAGDISAMSPDERATRLFNRVMRLEEEGKSDSVSFFVPMALQAYEMLPSRDADARFHMALLQLAAGDAPGALAQADSIARIAPNHLFGLMVRARVAHARGDGAGERRALLDFAAHEREERARPRPEYQDHAAQLDAFSRQAANAAR